MLSDQEHHLPVLLKQVLLTLSPKDDEIYVDGTFGLGGYANAILKSADCTVYGIDRDPQAKAYSEKIYDQYGNRFHFLQGCFGNMEALLHSHHITKVDGVVLDLGVSSPQLDRAERGFSFKKEGPLDMRMGSDSLTAADVVNTYGEKEIADIIYTYGEEKKSRHIARMIVKRRLEKEFQTTQELADLIRDCIPFERKGLDPATRAFQALRIYVNDELGELSRGLMAAERLLKPGGRLVIVTFHSLEDRIVKSFLRDKSAMNSSASRHLPEQPRKIPTFKTLTKKALIAEPAEIRANPRSRSAKLRAAVRTEGGLNA